MTIITFVCCIFRQRRFCLSAVIDGETNTNKEAKANNRQKLLKKLSAKCLKSKYYLILKNIFICSRTLKYFTVISNLTNSTLELQKRKPGMLLAFHIWSNFIQNGKREQKERFFWELGYFSTLGE